MTKQTIKRGELRQRLALLLDRPDGMVAREALPIVNFGSEADAWSRLQKMAKRGEVFSAVKPGAIKRYFSTAEAAAAWLASARHDPVPSPTTTQNLTIARRKPAAVRVSGDIRITEKTRVTLDTTQHPTARWQVLQLEPDERWPSFAAARPGINPDTGKAWEAAA